MQAVFNDFKGRNYRKTKRCDMMVGEQLIQNGRSLSARVEKKPRASGMRCASSRRINNGAPGYALRQRQQGDGVPSLHGRVIQIPTCIQSWLLAIFRALARSCMTRHRLNSANIAS